VSSFFCIGFGGAVAQGKTKSGNHTQMATSESNGNGEQITEFVRNRGHEQPITTSQLALHLQVTTRTLATYRAKQLIPFWKINARNFRYRLSDVEKALAKNKR
jgi:hypothetical protein